MLVGCGGARVGIQVSILYKKNIYFKKSIVVVQTASITKKKRRKTGIYCGGHPNHRYK